MIVKRDQKTSGDGLLVGVTEYDQNGRVALAQELEDASTQSATDSTAGIKVQTRFMYSGGNSYKLVSNPYRAATSAGASSETTMGWTLVQYDQNGRVFSEQSFDGSGLPAPWGSNANSSGIVSMDYEGQQTTVTDQRGKLRRNQVDGLGRLTQVTEDPGQLNYQTVYGFDALDDLACVNQISIGANGICDVAQPHARSFVYDSLKRLNTATNPESGTISYTYDAGGNLLTKTDARGITCFGTLSGGTCTPGYDALNRIMQKSYSDPKTPAVTYSYDPNVAFGRGRLGSISNANAVMSYTSFDAFGNVLTSSQWITGQTYTFTYTYNLAGLLASETYPSGRVVTTGYDAANRPFTTTGMLAGQQTGYNAQTGYAAHGAVAGCAYGNGLVPVYTYNNRLQAKEIDATIGNDPNRYLLALTYDWGTAQNNGTLQEGSEGYGAAVPYSSLTWLSQSYTYDRVNRLESVTDTGYSRNFCSDAFGNIWVTGYTGIVPAGNTPQMINGPCPSSTTPYQPNNRINGGSYDAAGNQTLVNGNALVYDAENRLISETDSSTQAMETLAYDGEGRRVSKTNPGGTTIYVHDALGQLAAEYWTATNTPACTTCYLVWDHLGSTRLVTDSSAAVISRHDYLPFGEEIGPDVRGSGWGSTTDVTQKFTGKERDQEMQLDYFGARYYGAALGRFTSPDAPLADQDENNPQSWNLYSYVRNNPLRFTDPNGRECTYDSNTNNFTGDCSSAGDEKVTQGDKPQITTVGAFGDAGIAALAAVGAELSDPHSWVQFGSDAGRATASVVWPGASGVAECITPGGKCDKMNLAMAVLPGALGRAGRAIRILEEADGVIHLEVKTAQGTYEVIANITREGDKIVLEGAHIQGSGSGQFGPGLLKELRAAARQFMEQEGVSAVEVRPGVRTSGANPGRAMRPFTVTR